ncbi:hypothetical protein Tco_0668818 [Tanacetum coccineum]
MQQYEQFIIFKDESIDNAFTRFNTIFTSLKSLDEGYCSKNYVKKFLMAPHSKNYVKNYVKKFLKRDPNHLISECPKPPRDKNQRAFVGSSLSDSSEEDDKKAKDETCLMAQASSEVHFEASYFSDENSSIDGVVR